MALKLYVLGESSGDPDDWGAWGRRALVLAETSEQALALHDAFGLVAEVKGTRPVLLAQDRPTNEI